MHAFRLLLSVSVVLGVIARDGDPIPSPTAPPVLAALSAVAGISQVDVPTPAAISKDDAAAAKKSIEKEASWDELTPPTPPGEGKLDCLVLVKVKNRVFKDKKAKILLKLEAEEGEAKLETANRIAGVKVIGDGHLEKCDQHLDKPKTTGKILLKTFAVGAKKGKKFRVQGLFLDLHAHEDEAGACVESGNAVGTTTVKLFSKRGLKKGDLKVIIKDCGF